MTGPWAAIAGLLVAAAVLVLPGDARRDWGPRRRRPRGSLRGLWRRFRSRDDTTGDTDSRDPGGELPAFLDVMAPGLRAGRTPEEAAALACEVVPDGPVVRTVVEALRQGVPLPGALRRHAEDDAVRLFAQAWELSVRTGCPLATSAEVAARGARAALVHRRRVETATTGARATMRILTALPLCGPLLAFAVGVDPVGAYLASPVAWGAVLAGILLVVLGRRWVAGLVARAVRGPVLGENPIPATGVPMTGVGL